MIGGWQFGDLKMFGYDWLNVDPPWDFELYSEAGALKSASAQYSTMTLDAIKALRVGELARGDRAITLWGCEWMRPSDRESVLTAWGFRYVSALIWRKVTKNGKPAMGPGYRVRTMHETVYLGVIGNPQHKALPSLFNGVRRQHSRKPDEFFTLVEKAAPGASRADLFSRQSRPGWDTWGREATKFDGAHDEPERRKDATA